MSCKVTAICCLTYPAPSKFTFSVAMAKARHCGAIILVYHVLRPEPTPGYQSVIPKKVSSTQASSPALILLTQSFPVQDLVLCLLKSILSKPSCPSPKVHPLDTGSLRTRFMFTYHFNIISMRKCLSSILSTCILAVSLSSRPKCHHGSHLRSPSCFCTISAGW